MSFQVKRQGHDEAELDITAFMNLMIVLVPVLLMSLVFTRTTVLDVNLPSLTGGTAASGNAQGQLEVVINQNGFKVYYPENVLIKTIPMIEPNEESAVVSNDVDKDKSDSKSQGFYDYKTLSLVLQEVKQNLKDERSVLLRSEEETHYQTLIHTMDAVRSFQTVLAGSLVEVELFPEISLGDAS